MRPSAQMPQRGAKRLPASLVLPRHGGVTCHGNEMTTAQVVPGHGRRYIFRNRNNRPGSAACTGRTGKDAPDCFRRRAGRGAAGRAGRAGGVYRRAGHADRVEGRLRPDRGPRPGAGARPAGRDAGAAGRDRGRPCQRRPGPGQDQGRQAGIPPLGAGRAHRGAAIATGKRRGRAAPRRGVAGTRRDHGATAGRAAHRCQRAAQRAGRRRGRPPRDRTAGHRGHRAGTARRAGS